jgi:[protein-PII] uridylyltransferase
VLHAVSLLDARRGQTADTAWRQELVAGLVNRVAHVLEGGEMHEVAWPQFPTSEVRELMALPRTVLRADGHRPTVVAPERPGLFSRVAGVLSLHGLDVLGAQAHSDDRGMAASEFRVAGPAEGALEWERVIADLRLALDGRLALESRLAERALGSPASRVLLPGSVSIDNAASALATVVEVRATDSPGLLYRVTRALADMGLDIRHARVQTLGEDVLDTFYVRDILGDKVTDWRYLAEIERAVLHELTRA